jgi:hypothetical protein
MAGRSVTGRSVTGRSVVRAVLGGAAAVTMVIALAGFSTPAAAGVAPNQAGALDCNGFSTIQRPVRPTMVCADIRNTAEQAPFEDNGHYIGHDEPSIRFVSSRPGSADDVTFNETLPRDPAAAPTVNQPGADVTHHFELTVAPWFSMVLCDPNSTPLLPCSPESDANAPSGKYPGGGAAFMELQFYPPGFAPFLDNISCDNAHWCGALTIDSLACTQTFVCNPKCIEPVNFAFLETNGVPPGPPSPQLSNTATYTPDSHTLLMDPGDRLSVHMFDAALPKGRHALETQVQDLTTGETGYMVASAANGFMTTDPFNCKGRPFNFEPSYSSAGPANIIPWGPGAYSINTQFEIGHFEPCTAVTQGAGTRDPSFTQCHGPYESPLDPRKSPEPTDAPCYRVGDTHGGTAPPNLVTGCVVGFGDLDFDGTPYWADWPDGTTPDRYPSTFLQQQPTSGGTTYPQIQFVADTAGSETGCNTDTGQGCAMPPTGPGHFFPYWTLARVGGSCVWAFGNVASGNTFGADKQYGTVGPGTLGAFQGPVRTNPSSC